MKREHPIRWRFEGVAVAGAVGVLRALPERRTLALGAAAGRAAASFDSYYRRLALANLGLVFPEWDAVGRHELLRRSFAELGRNAAEWANLPGLSPDQIRARAELRGIEHLEGALAKGKGVLVVSAHYGYWEMNVRALGVCLGQWEITGVGRDQPNPYLRAMVSRRRSLGGAVPIPQNARTILKALRRNAAIGLLADHYYSKRKGGLLVPFLGLRAWSNPGPAMLALRAGCSVIIAHAHRDSGSRYRLELEPELELPRGQSRQARIIELTARINERIGELILREPALWLWATHRWRGSPDVPADLYTKRRNRRRR